MLGSKICRTSIEDRMSLTSKSPPKVALGGLAAAQCMLAAYSHRFSPQKFTPYQLFAGLVVDPPTTMRGYDLATPTS